MKKHTKIYLKEMGFTMADTIPCEVCGGVAVDIHHIEARGMGGDKTKDIFSNLIALCRPCHEMAETSVITKKQLKLIVESRT